MKMNKNNYMILAGIIIFIVLIAMVHAGSIYSIPLHSPENETVTSNQTPTFNFTVTGSDDNYSVDLYMCSDTSIFYKFNGSGVLINEINCIQECYDTTHTNSECSGGVGCSA